MAEIQFLMPEMGESVTDATITKWLKNEGDYVNEDEDLIEVATDKVDTELPSPVSGVIAKILHQEGETVDVGKPLAIISTDAEDSGVADSPAVQVEEPKPEPIVTEAELKTGVPFIPAPEPVQFGGEDRFYSPLVKTIAKKEGISLQELDNITGTGKEGRVTKHDVFNYLEQRHNGKTPEVESGQSLVEESQSVPTPTPTPTPAPAQAVSLKGNDEIIQMDRMRKLIADHMVYSKQTSPHATLFMEADVTDLANWRARIKDEFARRERQKLTFTPLFIEAVTDAIKKYPGLNVSVDGDNIIYKKSINIGMATALPSGSLIVPVVKDCASKSLVGLAKEVNDLAERARNSNLKPDETVGGTFTLTNIGTFDNLMGTPIINQPQVAILATGAIKKKPVVLETEAGDVIAIRNMMYLSLTMDHRVVDGALGGAFLKQVAMNLENWDKTRTA